MGFICRANTRPTTARLEFPASDTGRYSVLDKGGFQHDSCLVENEFRHGDITAPKNLETNETCEILLNNVVNELVEKSWANTRQVRKGPVL